MNPKKWQISRWRLAAALFTAVVLIALLFNLDPQYQYRWIRDISVIALLFSIPALIAMRLRTVGLSMLWLVGPLLAILAGAIALVAIIVSTTGASSAGSGAEIFVYVGMGGLCALGLLTFLACRRSELRNTFVPKNDT